MVRKRTDALPAAILPLLITGCLMPGAEPATQKAQAPSDAARSDAQVTDDREVAASPSERERLENLRLVEAFLERTRQDELDESPVDAPRVASRALEGVESGHGGAERRDRDRPQEANPNPVRIETPDTTPAQRDASQALANQHLEIEPHQPEAPRQAKPVVRGVSVRVAGAARGDDSDTRQAAPQVTNAPLDIRAGQAGPTLTELVDQLVDQLADQLAGTDDIDEQWRLSLIRLALGEDRAAAEVSENLSPEARRMLSTFVAAATAARRAARDPSMVSPIDLDAAGALHSAMRELADPVVDSIAFCRRVGSFGVFDEMDESAFTSGASTQTIVYCQVRNFTSVPTAEGQYRTLLGTQMRIMTADGGTVWEDEVAEIEDICRDRRSDFFIAKRITLPDTLEPGEHVLKVFVEDKLSGKGHEAARRFHIGGPGAKLAGS